MYKPPLEREDYSNFPTEELSQYNNRTKFESILHLFSKLRFLNILRNHDSPLKYLKPAKKKVIQEKMLLANFQEFNDKIVEDIVIPRSAIIAVRDDVTMDELNQLIIKHAHTRILVYNDTLDNIIGFVHIKDLFRVLAKKQNFDLTQLIRKPIIVAPSMKLLNLLSEMKKKCTHIAVVVDEYGGTDGMVTIEDIIEEIFGRIGDEHDEKLKSDSYKIIDNHTILSSSRVQVEELERILGVQLKEDGDEFDTIGGLVLYKVGSVPISGTKIDITDKVEIEVISANPRTLKLLKLRLKEGQIQAD